jgi:hypothetical protein
MGKKKKFLCPLSVKDKKLELSSTILVTKNPNLFQSLDKETDCIKRRY